jgi:hypothetical protein
MPRTQKGTIEIWTEVAPKGKRSGREKMLRRPWPRCSRIGSNISSSLFRAIAAVGGVASFKAPRAHFLMLPEL